MCIGLGVGTAALVGTAVSVGTAAYTSSQQKKAAKRSEEQAAKQGELSAQGQAETAAMQERLLKEADEPLSEEDLRSILEAAQMATEYNAGPGYDLASGIATRSNDTTLSELEKGMSRLFGGGDTFNNLRNQVNTNIGNALEGRIAPGTQRLLGRRALETGAPVLGEGAVADALTNYLGLTAEDQSHRGIQEYQTMYQTYRTAFPMATPLDAMRYTTVSPSEIIQGGMGLKSQRMGAINAAAGLTSQGYNMGMNALTAESAAADAAAAADIARAQMWGRAAGGLVSSLTAFSQPQPGNYYAGEGNNAVAAYRQWGGVYSAQDGRQLSSAGGRGRFVGGWTGGYRMAA